MAQLVKRTLRQNPDRVVVGEVLGRRVADSLTVRPALGFIDASDLDKYHNRGTADDHTDIRQRNKQSRRM